MVAFSGRHPPNITVLADRITRGAMCVFRICWHSPPRLKQGPTCGSSCSNSSATGTLSNLGLAWQETYGPSRRPLGQKVAAVLLACILLSTCAAFTGTYATLEPQSRLRQAQA
jgi:hypothetical protein